MGGTGGGGGHAMPYERDSGLTPFGRDVVNIMNERGAVIDLSHKWNRGDDDC